MQPTLRRGHSYHHRYYPGRTLFWRFVVRWRDRLRGRVLDLGGGSRPYQPLAAPGTKYITIDLTALCAPDAIGDARRLPFGPASFDAVLCTEVLEHIFETDRTLAEIRRVLRPGGTVIITTPFIWGLHYAPHDYFRFTPYALRRLMEDQGLEVLQVERLGGLWMAAYMRLSDVGHNLLGRLLDRLHWPRPWQERCFKALRLLPNLVALALCPLLDRLHQADAMNYGSVATRPERVA